MSDYDPTPIPTHVQRAIAKGRRAAKRKAHSLHRPGSATPFCVRWRCEKAKLHWLKKGHSLQTENGHFTAGGDGWICPRCGGGYGNTPSPNDQAER